MPSDDNVPRDPAGDPWQNAMRSGDFARAWEISDQILRERAGRPCHDRPRHLQYIWDGRPVAGKRVLVRCYHGLGDTVQFIRFVPDLQAIAAHVTVWAQPELLPLLRDAFGLADVLPLHDGAPDCDYDVDLELMEVPHALRISLGDVGKRVPYFRLPRAHALRDTGPRLSVGVVWRAGDWNAQRSIPADVLRPMHRVPGVQWHVLQQGDAFRDWPNADRTDARTPRIEVLATVMSALDLVITVDSFPAHLAGALGVRTWTLLHADADWRWMQGRTDSPWYPTMQLFRQPTAGAWDPVIEQVAVALVGAVAAKQSAASCPGD